MRKLLKSMLLLMALAILSSETATATTYIKELGIYYFYTGGTPVSGTKKDYSFRILRQYGYTPVDLDLNCGGGGGDVYLGYKTTTNPAEAIKDIVIMMGSKYYAYTTVYFDHTKNTEYLREIDIDGRTFTAVPSATWAEVLEGANKGKWVIEKDNTDLNAEAGGEYLYIYTTKETDPESGIRGITSIDAFAQASSTVNVSEGTFVGRGFDGLNWYPDLDLNKGTKKHHLNVYLTYTAERVQRYFLNNQIQTSWNNIIGGDATDTDILQGKFNSGEGISTIDETKVLPSAHTSLMIDNCEGNWPYAGKLETPLFDITGRRVTLNGGIVQNNGKGAAMRLSGGALTVKDGALKSAGTTALDVQSGTLTLQGGTIGYTGSRPASGFTALHMQQGASIFMFDQTEFSRFYGISTESDHVYDVLPYGYTLAEINGTEVTPYTMAQMSGQRITGKWLTIVPCPHHGVSTDVFEDGDYNCINCGHVMHFHLKHTPTSANGGTCSTCGRDIIASVNAGTHTEYLCSLDTLQNYLDHLCTTSPLGTITLAAYRDIQLPGKTRIWYRGTNDFKVVNGPLSSNVTISGDGYNGHFALSSKKITFDGVSLNGTGTGYNSETLLVKNGTTVYFQNGSILSTQKPALVVESGSSLILSNCDFEGFTTPEGIHRIPRGEEQTLHTLNGDTYTHYEGEETASNTTHLYVRACDHSRTFNISEGINKCQWCKKVFYDEGKEPFYAILTYIDSDDNEQTKLLTEFGATEFDLVNQGKSATLTLYKNMSIDGQNGELKSGHELTITHDETTTDGQLTLNVVTSGYEDQDWDLNSIYVDENATLNIEGVNIVNDYHWAITNEGTLNLYSGTITASQAVDNYGTFNMYGGTLVGRQDSKAANTTLCFDFGTLGMSGNNDSNVFNMYGGTIRTESTVEDAFVSGQPSAIRQRAFYLEDKGYKVNINEGLLENGFVNYLVSTATLQDLISSPTAYVRVGNELCTRTDTIQQTDKTIVVGHCTNHDWNEWAETGRTYDEGTSTLVIHEAHTCQVCGTTDTKDNTIESLAAIFTDGYDSWYYTPEEVEDGLKLPGFANANATLSIYKDVAVKESIAVTGASTELTVEGNGKSLSCEASTPLFSVTGGAKATFTNVNLHANGTAIQSTASSVTLNGGHMLSETGHAIDIQLSSTLTMNDGSLETLGDLTCRDLKADGTSQITIYKGDFLNDSQTTGIAAGQWLSQIVAEGSAYYLDSEHQNPLLDGLNANSLTDKELHVAPCTSHFCSTEPSGDWRCAICRKNISETPVAHVEINYLVEQESKTDNFYTNDIDAALDYINNYSGYSASATVTLAADAEVTKPHTFGSKSSIGIQGNSHTITSAQDFPIFESGAQSLTLSDLNLQTTGDVPAIYAVNGSLTINGGNYSAANGFHALVASDYTDVEVVGGTFEGGVLCGSYASNEETASATTSLVDVLGILYNFKYTDGSGNVHYLKPYETVGNNNTLEVYELMLGDANHDGRISISDITAIIANLNGGTAIIDHMQANANQDTDYTIDTDDIDAIRKIITEVTETEE